MISPPSAPFHSPAAPSHSAIALEPAIDKPLSARSSSRRRGRSSAVKFWVAGAVLLLGAQLASGTDVTYAVLVMMFVIFTGLTATFLGGPRNLVGLCCLVFAFQHVILSQIVKVWMWEPADAPLSEPTTTMGAYVVSMLAILAAVYLTKLCNLQRRKPILPISLEPRPLFVTSLIITALCILRYLALIRLGVTENGSVVTGGIIGPIRQLQFLPALSVAAGTAHVLVTSQNKRSFGVLNLLAIVVTFLFGFLGAGRSTMAGALIPYVITCLSFGYKFRWTHYASLAAIVYFAQFILFPYALFARNTVRTGDFKTNVENASTLLIDVIQNPAKYQITINQIVAPEVRRFLYFGKPLPTLDRYAVLITTDGIVQATLKQGTTEMETITPGFESVVPSFLNPNKTQVMTSNVLAHRARGLVSKRDFTTGITVGFVADAFSSYSWAGAFVIPLLITFFFTAIYSAIAGSFYERNIVYSALSFSVSWLYSEATIQSIISLLTLQAVLLVMVFWLVQIIVLSVVPKSAP